MIVREILDDVEQQLDYHARANPGRLVLLQWLSQELNELTGRQDWDWAMTWIDPAITTVDGTDSYLLPRNFPANFVSVEDEFLCKIDDGTTESMLTYENPATFHANDFHSSTDSKPDTYTIMTTNSGQRKIKLYPCPDDDYNVSGVYIPTDWSLTEQEQLPPVPGNCAALKYGVLRRLDPAYDGRYQVAYGELLFQAARARKTSFVPIVRQFMGGI